MILGHHLPRMSHSSSLTIVPNTIGKMLGEKNLCVPLSQRSYRWKDEHIEYLFQDIEDALDDKEYFVGSIVSIQDSGKTFIYDGQQRLATTMVLIAAIRDFMLQNDDPDAATTESEFLISRKRQSSSSDPHLRLNAEDADFFRERILLRATDAPRMTAQPQKPRDSHKRIESAARIARKKVQSIVSGRSPKDSAKLLNKWLDFVKEKLTVIWVQVADQKTAFRIFETMNDRGLKLSAADLLKNYLHAEAEDLREEIIQKWSAMAGVLETIDGEEENVVEYVRCFWITEHGHTRTKDLFDEIKKEVTSPTKAVAFATKLERTAQDYAAIIMSSHEQLAKRGEEVAVKIDTIREFGVTQLRPLILAAFRKFKPMEFSKLLDGCVTWTVRTLIAGVPSGTIEGHYSKNALAVTNGTYATAREVLKAMATIVPDDARFESAFKTATVSSPKLARYYLRAMQRCADGESEPQYLPNSDQNTITLEHILPLVPDSTWKHFSADEHKRYVKRVGNLALLPKKVNSDIKSISYKDKKEVMASATEYSLTLEAVKDQERWKPADIDERQALLAELAVRTWPLL